MILQELKAYLNKTLGIQTQTHAWENTKALPFFLLEKYDFYSALMLNSQCLFMVAKEKEESTPAIIKKHFMAVKKAWSGDIIYVARVITPMNRVRLIEQKVPFIAPEKQLYIPEIGLDLREHMEKIRIKTETLSPATQVIILDALNQGGEQARNVHQLAKEFCYTTMTITRVMDEIEEFEIGKIRVFGRERRLSFELPKKQLWEKAMPYLKNPVLKNDFARDINPGKDITIAGLNALSKFSNIAETNNRTYAVSQKKYRSLKMNSHVKFLPDTDDGADMIEVWRYWPERLAKDGIVDKFSLFLSLKNDEDERVQSALKMMMEKVF